MRIVVFAVIAGVAVLIGVQLYLSFSGQDCPNGRVVADETACLQVAGFDAAFCRAVFARAADVTRASGAVYATQDECIRRDNPVCVAVENPIGWVARPAGFCVARAADGGIQRMTPVYQGHARRG